MTASSAPTIWWFAFGLVIAVELATGTVYLLMIGSGLMAGAAAAHAGWTTPVQIVIAAVVGGSATLLWHRHRRLQPSGPPPRENPDVMQDIGAHIDVAAWSVDRSARVVYRGAEWTARLHDGAVATAGPHRVASVEGNWLVLVPA